MTTLQRNALAHSELSRETIERLYETPFQCLALDAYKTLRVVLESHERLRNELQGAQEVIADLERQLDDAIREIGRMVRE